MKLNVKLKPCLRVRSLIPTWSVTLNAPRQDQKKTDQQRKHGVLGAGGGRGVTVAPAALSCRRLTASEQTQRGRTEDGKRDEEKTS